MLGALLVDGMATSSQRTAREAHDLTRCLLCPIDYFSNAGRRNFQRNEEKRCMRARVGDGNGNASRNPRTFERLAAVDYNQFGSIRIVVGKCHASDSRVVVGVVIVGVRARRQTAGIDGYLVSAVEHLGCAVHH